jgi:hypothetical protein
MEERLLSMKLSGGGISSALGIIALDTKESIDGGIGVEEISMVRKKPVGDFLLRGKMSISPTHHRQIFQFL